MARPKKLTLDFFIHSANARNDRRIKSLRRRENNDGYATYYILLEMSCSEKEMKLHLDNEIIVEDIADECGLRDVPHLYKVIESCVSVGLFNPQLWKSERIVFSDDLYNSYLDRLEDRKATAERKQRFSEVKTLQEKINQVTQENPVVTQENPVVTQENPVVTQENPVVTRDNPPEIQNYRTTENQNYRTTYLQNKNAQKTNDRIFEMQQAERDKWTHSEIDCGALVNDSEFVEYIKTVYLPSVPDYRNRDVNDSLAKGWISKGKRNPERRDLVEIQLEAFEVWRSRQQKTVAAPRKKAYALPRRETWTAEQARWSIEQWEEFLSKQEEQSENTSYTY